MHILTMQYLTTMQDVPTLDRKLLCYAGAWILAIGACVAGVAAFA